MVGLRGDATATRAAARAYRVYYAKAKLAGDNYTVDHSGFVYLMGRDGRYLGFFPPGTAPERMAAAIKPHLAAPAKP
jgi:cytochrome oxidase Cu insertion factor (SCO1/SenC/PrrC family)